MGVCVLGSLAIEGMGCFENESQDLEERVGDSGTINVEIEIMRDLGKKMG